MGVEDDILKAKSRETRFGPSLPDLPEEKLMPPNLSQKFRTVPAPQVQVKEMPRPAPSIPQPNTAAPAPETGFTELRTDIRKLTVTINEMLKVFKKAGEDLKEEPAGELSSRLDKLVKQNEEMGRALLLLLELHREHIPRISKHARISSPLKLRRSSRMMFDLQK